MILEPNTERCVSKEVELRRGVDMRRCANKDAGLRRGWIVRSYIGWRGERNTLYKGRWASKRGGGWIVISPHRLKRRMKHPLSASGRVLKILRGSPKGKAER